MIEDDEARAESVELSDYEQAVDQQGYIGTKVDTSDDYDYTVAGVVARAAEEPPKEGDPLHKHPERVN
jgi:hypothetical protein